MILSCCDENKYFVIVYNICEVQPDVVK